MVVFSVVTGPDYGVVDGAGDVGCALLGVQVVKTKNLVVHIASSVPKCAKLHIKKHNDAIFSCFFMNSVQRFKHVFVVHAKNAAYDVF